MNTDSLLSAAQTALGVPLTPAPCLAPAPCAVYRLRPGRCDGTLETTRFIVRDFAPSHAEAYRASDSLRRALTADGDRGVVGRGADAVVCVRTREDSTDGRSRTTGAYYVQSAFDCLTRA